LAQAEKATSQLRKMARKVVRSHLVSSLLAAVLCATHLACFEVAFVGSAPSFQLPHRSLVQRQNADNPMLPPPDVTGPPIFGTERSSSGLAWRVLEQGDPAGECPQTSDRVALAINAWRTNGELVESTYMEEPTQVSLDFCIKGLKEGVSMMRPGEKRRLWIPGKLANGEEADATDEAKKWGPPLGMLVYDVQYLGVKPYEFGGFTTFFAGLGAILLILSVISGISSPNTSESIGGRAKPLRATTTFEIPTD